MGSLFFVNILYLLKIVMLICKNACSPDGKFYPAYGGILYLAHTRHAYFMIIFIKPKPWKSASI